MHVWSDVSTRTGVIKSTRGQTDDSGDTTMRKFIIATLAAASLFTAASVANACVYVPGPYGWICEPVCTFGPYGYVCG